VVNRLLVIAAAVFSGSALALLAGCGGAADAGTVQVAGTVTVDDKPIAQASVAFIGNEGARLASASTDSSGKFKLRAALGKNVVTVAKAPPAGAAPVSAPDTMPSEGEYQKLVQAVKANVSEVPEKYGDPKTSGLQFDITPKMTSLDLVLTKK